MDSVKKFSDSYLKQNGVDAHKVKKMYHCNPLAHYDLYKGKTVTIRDKKGKLFADTGLTVEEFFEKFGNKNKNLNKKGERYGREK